jgi:hypothetical protein
MLLSVTLMLYSCCPAQTIKKTSPSEPLELERGFYECGDSYCIGKKDLDLLMVDYAIIKETCK